MARATKPLPTAAAVVIVGGGVMGTSAAFHLAEAGVEVVLLERDQLGSGSTSRAAGGVRAQFSDALNIQIASRSLAAFREFGSRPGWEIDLRQVGYLFVLNRDSDVETFERNVATQNELGVPSRMVSAADARRLCPLLAGEDIIAGAYSPEDGHATPEAVVQGYAFAARQHGADLRVGCEVSGVETRGGEITAVVTSQGTIRTSVVICTAGAWAGACGEMVGVDLPVTPMRRQVMFTEPMPSLPAEVPMTIDFETGFYFHREGPGLMLGMAEPEEQEGFSLEAGDEWIPGLMEVVARRAPLIGETGIRGGWAGLYEMTPDHNAVIGESADVSRFIYAAGFSGHGFLQAPAVGELLRDLYLGRPTFVDIAPLAVERFGSSSLRPEFNVI